MTTKVALTEDQFSTSAIRFGKIESRIISGGIKVNGVLDVPPQNLVSVSAPLGGFVKNTVLLQGMKVQKGEVLVSLEGPEYIQLQQDYLTNKSQLDFMQLEYQRQQDLAKENVNAVKTLQQARSNFLTTKAKLEGSRAMLKMIGLDPMELENGSIQSIIKIFSPISGFITQVNINLGMHVNPTDVMFRIIDTDHLHAEAQVFEKDISRLKVGQKVRVILSNDPRERLATVYLIGKEITADRTVRVHCHFEEEDPTLIPGMYFSAVIEVANRAVPSLPDEAMVTFEGKKYIFISTGKLSFEMREVKTGASESGFTEVILPESVAADSTKVVTFGTYDLLSKLKNNEQ